MVAELVTTEAGEELIITYTEEMGEGVKRKIVLVNPNPHQKLRRHKGGH